MLSLMEVYSMTDTTQLSPAAQAVLDASLLMDSALSRSMVAAALRAAAEHLGESRAPGVEFEDLYGRIVDVDDLLAIAAELEGNA